MLLVSLCSFTIIALAFLPSSQAAKCDGDHQFEYKFRPIKIHPIKRDDYKNSKARCGPGLEGEKLCDLMITVGGSLGHCHIGNGFQMFAPKDKNFVDKGFKPAVHRYEAWTHGRSEPFKIEVCDDDSAFRFRNDHLFTIQHENLRRGCHRHKFNDRHQNHPWLFDYELCCRPLGNRDDDYDDRDEDYGRGGNGRGGRRRDRERERERERDDYGRRERERHRERDDYGRRERERHRERDDYGRGERGGHSERHHHGNRDRGGRRRDWERERERERERDDYGRRERGRHNERHHHGNRSV